MTISGVLAPLAARAVAIEAASTLITATAGESGPPITGEKVEVSGNDHAGDHRAHDEPGKAERKSPLARSPVKDERGEGDAIRNLHDRRDAARQGVEPKAPQVSVARALKRQICERCQGQERFSEWSGLPADRSWPGPAAMKRAKTARLRWKSDPSLRSSRSCGAHDPPASASRRWRSTASHGPGRGRSSR